MVRHEDLWKENGEINNEAIIPDVNIVAFKTVEFRIDEERERYENLTIDNENDEACFVKAVDGLGNSVEIEIFGFYDEDLKEVLLKEGIRVYDKNGEEQYSELESCCDDLSKMTNKEIEESMLQEVEYVFNKCYNDKTLEKPNTTLVELLNYVGSKYALADKGDDISVVNFPSKGIETYFTKNLEADNLYAVNFFNSKNKTKISEAKENMYCDLYNTIMDIADGSFVTDSGKTIGEIIEFYKKDKNIERD